MGDAQDVQRLIDEAVRARDEIAKKIGTAEQNLMRLQRGEKFEPIARPSLTSQPELKAMPLSSEEEIDEFLRNQIADLRARWAAANLRTMQLQGLRNMPPELLSQVLRQRREQEENRRGAAGLPPEDQAKQEQLTEQQRRHRELMAIQEANRRRAQGLK